MLLLGTICCARKKPRTQPLTGWYYKVKSGDTVALIAKRASCDEELLRRINSLPRGKEVFVGQLLFIPGDPKNFKQPFRVTGASTSHSPPAKRVAPSATTPTRTNQPALAAKPTDKTPKKPLPTPVPSASKTTKMSEKKTQPPAQSKPAITSSPVKALPSSSLKEAFRMPLQGKITRKFSVGGNTVHKGIDIAAPEGTAIYAARSGKVIYSDDSIPGYGNMIIIDHLDGFCSLYAHNKKNLVKVNQSVKRGERIALVGQTGKATAPHLHFEIRYKAEAVDPMKYFPSSP